MNENNSEIIDVEWFDAGQSGHPGQNIGVVLIYNEHAGFKCYMGIGNGISIPDDTENIYRLGNKISQKLAHAYWGSRMHAEWVTRQLSDDEMLKHYYKYDGNFVDKKA